MGGLPLDLPRRAFRRRPRPTPLVAEQPGEIELARRLRTFDVFAGLPDQAVAELASAGTVRIFRADEAIWREGQPSRHALFIEQGLTKTSRRNRRGVSRTYGFHGPGDSMGIYAIWARTNYPTDAVAINNGMTAVLIASDTLVACADRWPRLSSALLVEIGRFTEAFMRKIDVVSAGMVPQRLATLMTRLIERYGYELPDRSAHLPLNLTLEHLSEIIDARVETVARVLGKWRRHGWLISDDDGYHILDRDSFESLLPR